jgi:type I restriction enzyme S subunit
MSFPRYPAYKPSGVEWLGEVPEDWSLKPVYGVASERDEDNKGMKEDNLLSLSYGSIVNKDINTSDGLLPESFETYQIVRPGDIVLRLTDLQNDKRSLRSALVTQTGIITSAYLALRTGCIDSRYLNYLLRAYDVSKVFYSMGGGLRQSMKYGDIKRMPLVVPTKTEQLAIATFLDRETAKIDALIAEQQRLIELLQEKRQSVISHAVTKGLNPDAPMKDSGVEWLGEVPDHWALKKIKYTARMESGHTPDRKIEAYWVDCDIPWVSLNDTGFLKDNDYISETAYSINELGMRNSSARLLPERVVVFSRDATIGRCAITTRPMAVSQHFIAWVCGEEILPEYLLLRLKSMTQELERLTFGATLKTIGMPDVKTLTTPVPPVSEQDKIVEYVTQAVSTLEEMSMKTRIAIALLQERRSTLISAAVTGQIDVRELAEAKADEQ